MVCLYGRDLWCYDVEAVVWIALEVANEYAGGDCDMDPAATLVVLVVGL